MFSQAGKEKPLFCHALHQHHWHALACTSMHQHAILSNCYVPTVGKDHALIPLWYPKYWYFLFVCEFTEIAGHANCHAKFPYSIAKIRVMVCRIEWTLTTDKPAENAPERIRMQDKLNWWRNNLFFLRNTPSSLNQLRMTFFMKGLSVSAESWSECRCAHAGEDGRSLQEFGPL